MVRMWFGFRNDIKLYKFFETKEDAEEWAREQAHDMNQNAAMDGYYRGDEVVVLARVEQLYEETNIDDELNLDPEEYGYDYWAEIRKVYDKEGDSNER